MCEHLTKKGVIPVFKDGYFSCNMDLTLGSGPTSDVLLKHVP